jgi:hypothetical protein
VYVELSTDDLAVIHKAIAEATASLTEEEVLRATIQKSQETSLYHLSLGAVEREQR